MADVEKEITCSNCGSNYSIIYDEEEVNYDPENCPFCGDVADAVDEDLDFVFNDSDDLLDFDEEDEEEKK
jgi:DNA-directed RNA polymerase subunit RPC12/RpoP